MKKKAGKIVLLSVLAASCASGPGTLKDIHETADVVTMKTLSGVTAGNAADILRAYSIPFEIPNPFQEDSQGSLGRFDPSHESVIKCTAVLLDSISTEADIMHRCRADSLDEETCRAFGNKYRAANLRSGTFRIRIEMESGFSEKSMDPAHWSLYIENADGVMIEPSDITVMPVGAVSDSVYYDYNERYYHRTLLKSEMTLYFTRKTFFGQDMLGPDNPSIVLVVSREKKVLARVAWKLASRTGRSRLP